MQELTRRVVLVLGVLSVVLVATTGVATTNHFQWTAGAASAPTLPGTYFEWMRGTNWVEGVVPGPSDTARFDAAPLPPATRALTFEEGGATIANCIFDRTDASHSWVLMFDNNLLVTNQFVLGESPTAPLQWTQLGGGGGGIFVTNAFGTAEGVGPPAGSGQEFIMAKDSARWTADKITMPNGGLAFNLFGGVLTTKHGVDITETIDFQLGRATYDIGNMTWNMVGGTNNITLGATELIPRIFALGRNIGVTAKSALNVSGPGTELNLDECTSIHVGDNSGSSSLVVSNGAALNIVSGLGNIKIGATAAGSVGGVNEMIVTGPDSSFDHPGFLLMDVAAPASQNLVVSDGGQLTTASNVWVGWGAPSSNNTVLVTGANSRWDIGKGTYDPLIPYHLEIARDGASVNNTVTVSDGGTLNVLGGDTFVGKSLLGTGSALTINNGNFYVRNTLRIPKGVVSIEGSSGTATAGWVIISSGSTLKFVADAGGVTTLDLHGSAGFYPDAGAKLQVDLSSHIPSAEPLILVQYNGSKMVPFAPGDITITGGAGAVRIDQAYEGNKIAVFNPPQGSIIMVQ